MGIRRALLIALAVPALLVGLLGMHTLGGGGHAAHASGPAMQLAAAQHDPVGAGGSADVHAAMVTHAVHLERQGDAGGVRAEASGAHSDLEATVAALACVLALLATLLLAAASDPARTIAARLPVAARGIAPPRRRRPPALSLAELSISRT
jgi:hypothetical protein